MVLAQRGFRHRLYEFGTWEALSLIPFDDIQNRERWEMGNVFFLFLLIFSPFPSANER